MIGWPQERGIVTIWIAHTTFCAAYVAVVVSARLRELDLSIEEAAMDLGAKPWKVFFLITIPMIAPSLAAGHDVVRAVAGRPGIGQLRFRAWLDHLADGSVLGGAPGREARDQRRGQPDSAVGVAGDPLSGSSAAVPKRTAAGRFSRRSKRCSSERFTAAGQAPDAVAASA